MTGAAIQALVSQGFGLSAAVLGNPCQLFRATGPGNPLDPANLVAQLPASFPFDEKFTKPPPPGKNASRLGLFDQANVLPGDHFVGPDGTFLVGSLLQFAWPQAFFCPRTITLYTAPTDPANGPGGYSGTDSTNRVALLTGWPAAIVEGGRGDPSGSSKLPGDVYMGGWTMYLSGAGGVAIDTTHIVTDDLNRTYIISSAELTDYWRVVMMQQKA